MAVYVALFVLIAGAAGALTVTAETPEISFDNPDFVVSSGDQIDANGESYTVADITESEPDDDGQTTMSAVLEREEEAELSETWSNGDTVEIDDNEWRVEIDGDEPTAFTLVEVFDRQAILEADDTADNETIERDDGEYVAVTDESGDTTLVPAEEYFPAPDERSYEAGDTFEYNNETVTVDAVTADGAVVVWQGVQTTAVELEEESTVTLGGSEYVAHFSDASTLTLSTDIEAYEAQAAEIEQFNQYTSGLFRVVLLGILSTVLLLAVAFVPTRY
ncbi:hypothetical protein [Halorubrum sp. DTA46]|uniref:hypothetical protein n=1 Tax=Halorubrum sp. DTA46 TaxID=3402162 RepID=UPI003AB0E3F5